MACGDQTSSPTSASAKKDLDLGPRAPRIGMVSLVNVRPWGVVPQGSAESSVKPKKTSVGHAISYTMAAVAKLRGDWLDV
jgi:hypothetical protein